MSGTLHLVIRRAPILLQAAACVLFGLQSSSAQEVPIPEPHPVDDSLPIAGYSRTIEAQAIEARAAAISPFLAPSPPSQRKRDVPVICFTYENVEPLLTVERLRNHLFGDPNHRGGPQPTMSQYFRDVSHGKWRMGGRVLGWHRLPCGDERYETDVSGEHDLHDELFGLVTDVLTRVDQEIDFSQYDNDGPDGIPDSGDDDGLVDLVILIHPKAGAETRRFGASPFWSHYRTYGKLAEKAGRPSAAFKTNDPRKGGIDGPIDDGDDEESILIQDYCFTPALQRPVLTAEDPVIPNPIGVLCHEYGHALRLPDLYDRNRPDNWSGIGYWCLMSRGGYGWYRHPDQPVHLSAWCKEYLRWARVELIDEVKTITLEPVEANGLVYRIDVPGTNRREYFLLEYRDKDWSDPDGLRINWDRTLPASGLAIWHVDTRVGDHANDWPMTPINEGQNDTAPLKRNLPKRALVWMAQADARLDLERSENHGDEHDLWTEVGAVFSDEEDRSPNSRTFDDKPTGISISLVGERTIRINPGGSSEGPPARPTRPLAMRRRDDEAVTELTPSPEDRPGDLIREIERKLDEVGVEALVPDEARALAGTPDYVLRRNATADNLLALRRHAAELRTSRMTADEEATSPVEEKVRSWLHAERVDRPVTVRLDPSGRGVERLTGLSLPRGAPSASEDARRRLAGPLGSVLTEGVDLVASTRGPQDAATPAFEQAWELPDGTRLPILGTEVRFHYRRNDGDLAAVVARTVPPDLVEVSGSTPMGLGDVKALVAEQLGLGASRINQCRRGILLVDDDPKLGRVGYELCIAMGEGKEPIHVFFDGETRSILEVETE